MMEIFSISKELRPFVEKVIYSGKPVSYSYGNLPALHRWLNNMNGREIDNALNMPKSRKYPLIWLIEGSWNGQKQSPGYRFDSMEFYISMNTEARLVNEDREPIFDELYKIANDFIASLKKSGISVGQNSIQWQERANFSEGDKAKSIDYWDTIILTFDLIANTNCFKHIKL